MDDFFGFSNQYVIDILRKNAAELSGENEEKLYNSFFAVDDYFKKVSKKGLCHVISSIHYVILKEQGIEAQLFIGEVHHNHPLKSYCFDHSWVETNGLIYDIAVQNPHHGIPHPPVYAGLELSLKRKPALTYGVMTGYEWSDDTVLVLKTPFVSYMDQFHYDGKGAWEMVQELCQQLGIVVEIHDMRKKYRNVSRSIRRNEV